MATAARGQPARVRKGQLAPELKELLSSDMVDTISARIRAAARGEVDPVTGRSPIVPQAVLEEKPRKRGTVHKSLGVEAKAGAKVIGRVARVMARHETMNQALGLKRGAPPPESPRTPPPDDGFDYDDNGLVSPAQSGAFTFTSEAGSYTRAGGKGSRVAAKVAEDVRSRRESVASVVEQADKERRERDSGTLAALLTGTDAGKRAGVRRKGAAAPAVGLRPREYMHNAQGVVLPPVGDTTQWPGGTPPVDEAAIAAAAAAAKRQTYTRQFGHAGDHTFLESPSALPTPLPKRRGGPYKHEQLNALAVPDPPPPMVAIPPTQIPKTEHIVHDTTEAQGRDKDAVFDKESRRWIVTAFPSLNPTGRAQVVHLSDWLDAKEAAMRETLETLDNDVACHPLTEEELADDARREAVGMAPARRRFEELDDVKSAVHAKLVDDKLDKVEAYRHALVEQQRYYSVAANEIVRQVGTQCLERGHLLARIWECHDRRFADLVRSVEPLMSRFRVMKEELLRKEKEVEETNILRGQVLELTRQLGSTKDQVKQLTDEIEYSRSKSRLADVYLDESKRLEVRLQSALRTISLRDEVVASRDKELEKQRHQWSGMVARLKTKISMISQQKDQEAAQAHQAVKRMALEQKLAIDEAVRTATSEGEAGTTTKQLVNVIDMLRQEVHKLRRMAHVDKNRFPSKADMDWDALMAEGALNAHEAKDAYVQTDPVSIAGEEAQSKTKASKDKLNIPDLWTKLIKKLPKGNGRLWGLAKTKQTILDIYMERVKMNEADGEYGGESVHMAEWVCSYFFTKYGVKNLVQQRIREIIQAINKHKSDSRVSFFARACGLTDPLPRSAVDNLFCNMHYLKEGLDKVLITLPAGFKPWKHMPDGATEVAESAAHSTVRRALAYAPDRVDWIISLMPRTSGGDKLQNRQGAAAKGDVAKVDLDHLLNQLHSEWEAHRTAETDKFRSVFMDVDDDGDGVLDVHEFEAALSVLGIRTTKQRTRQLYMQALEGSDSDFLDIDTFVELVSSQFRAADSQANFVDPRSNMDPSSAGAGSRSRRSTAGGRSRSAARALSPGSGVHRKQASVLQGAGGSGFMSVGDGSDDSVVGGHPGDDEDDDDFTPSAKAVRRSRAQKAKASATGAPPGTGGMFGEPDAGQLREAIMELVECVNELRPRGQALIRSPHLSPAIRYLLYCRVNELTDLLDILEDGRDDDGNTLPLERQGKDLQKAWGLYSSAAKAVQRAEKQNLERARDCLCRWVVSWQKQKMERRMAVSRAIEDEKQAKAKADAKRELNKRRAVHRDRANSKVSSASGGGGGGSGSGSGRGSDDEEDEELARIGRGRMVREPVSRAGTPPGPRKSPALSPGLSVVSLDLGK